MSSVKAALVRRIRLRKRVGVRAPYLDDSFELRVEFVRREDRSAGGDGTIPAPQMTMPPLADNATLDAVGVPDGCALVVTPRRLQLLVASSAVQDIPLEVCAPGQ